MISSSYSCWLNWGGFPGGILLDRVFKMWTLNSWLVVVNTSEQNLFVWMLMPLESAEALLHTPCTTLLYVLNPGYPHTTSMTFFIDIWYPLFSMMWLSGMKFFFSLYRKLFIRLLFPLSNHELFSHKYNPSQLMITGEHNVMIYEYYYYLLIDNINVMTYCCYFMYVMFNLICKFIEL